MESKFKPWERSACWYVAPNMAMARITLKQWQNLLLTNEDEYIALGNMYVIKAKKVGPGVYEIHPERKYPDEKE